MAREALSEAVGQAFGFACTASMVKGVMSRNRITSGQQYRFAKGNIPFNKGKKGVNGRSATTWSLGNRPASALPVGSERNNDGIIEIKVAEPHTWLSKHRLIWQQANGPVPAGSVIIFADQDRGNFALDNLLLVTRGELAVMNKLRLIKDNSQATTVGRTIARIKMACRNRQAHPKEVQP